MSYRQPTDLPQVPATWQDWPLKNRVLAACKRTDMPVWARLAAVAITLVEQPGKIPVGNCCGIMSQGYKKPWGWRVAQWQRVEPVGYAMLKEGQGGLVAPFLAFAKVEDSLNFLIDRCVSKGVYDGATYAEKWVGLTPGATAFASSALAFDNRFDRVLDELVVRYAREDERTKADEAEHG